MGNVDNLMEDESFYSFKGDLTYDLRIKYRLIRKNFSAFIRKSLKKDFSKILFVTTQTPPFDYINAFQKQYPDKKIEVLVPIIGEPAGCEKFHRSFEYYLQNRENHGKLYKLPHNSDNIQVYGIYSESFSDIENPKDFSDIKYIAPFMKCVRICAKKLKPDVIHSHDVPFFLGGEFENKLKFPIKVLQSVTDFDKYDCIDPFWAILNIADKAGMKKICRDKIIQKNIAALFNIHSIENFHQMRNCLETVYTNYLKFKDIQKENDDLIFKRLNTRILKMFSSAFPKNFNTYNSMLYTIKKCDFWATVSKTYYQSVIQNQNSKPLDNIINKTINKSGYLLFGSNNNIAKIHCDFDENNFRECRNKNRTFVLKELSQNRIETKFTDTSLWESNEVKVCGYLDSFYESVLIFAALENEMFGQGIDITINTILKLFEMNKNIQVILNVKEGINNNYIKSFIELCENHSTMSGRWLFIDGKINIPQFLSASDIILIPYRENYVNNLIYESIKYGCIPVISKSGILNDSLKDIYDDMSTGCAFKTDEALSTASDPAKTFEKAVLKALKFYNDNQTSYNAIIKNCLNYNVSWNFKTIEKYNEIYENLI